ncbi:hypothetical protein P3X46_024225 [Hevea brasiliensis]|uniref:Disease resistance RPP13-like protein 1 n=1 Tax=Hevea brasiliensis TaxID=3981 RepID=A0ABQ9L3C0_HEVBR|nr:putative disease resistance RPP13-like protein 1 [Hevea brasiliensis]XP_057991035.1 putative disease resistance RPP13-like protein 1 [Hevea brasiliensis]XP_057991036.1 putative disease resistance RPP13-like protein 1 [Hevea brasiliensis]XP_057991037.1 putative disease resistance RPP13-like protein 1 [Hevea brasiliensis]XP_057991038.1 putative disease resistance RPP13-like protein 1 [Hevea brasiliensis]KAJ9158661.1 hypothetical protein P3X46_024225 [Hevea brasiliensis]
MDIVTAVGGSILSVCFQGLLHRLNSIDFMKYIGQGQVLTQLKKWEKMLKRIHAVLEDAEEKQTANRLVEIWLSDLRDLAYDLEDIIDELATEVQRHNLEDKSVRTNNKVQNCFSIMCNGVNVNLNTVKFNAEMVAKIEKAGARLDEIIKQKDELRLAEYTRRRVSHVTERPPSTSLVNEAKVYGREEDKKAMLKLLNAETNDAEVSVIPIIGMGGLGKTTLAQLVYNDATLEFDLKAWVSVGEDFDVFRVTKTVLLQMGDSGDDEDLDSLQVKLKQKLLKQKFLVVLDDVWTENYEQWTVFRSPFEAATPQSRIIVTTRSLEVSLMMGTTPAYPLKELSYDECFNVFAQHALGATSFKEHLELKEMGEEIVKRCGGLPLAAKALGGILRGKPNPNVWKELLSSEIWELPNNKSNILPALRLSYLHLPPHLKQCFAYCAIFPKNYEVDKDELALLWMAEGFFYDQKEMKDCEGLGHKYFDDLLSRSFFQQSNDNKSKYIMHDLIHDLARFVSRGTCLHLVDKLESAKLYAKIRHSSFIPHGRNTFQRFESFYGMKSLRTFLSLSYTNEQYFTPRYYLSSNVMHDLVPKLKCLRVLSLTHYEIVELPDSIGALKHLRYLDLSRTKIKRLPESVDKLLNLQTLKLRDCFELIELPRGICNLLNLRHLDIIGTLELQDMPPHIGNLTSLCTLTKFVVGTINGRITELKKLNLQGQLHITSLKNVLDIEDADFANLKDKPGITELNLDWVDDDEFSSGFGNSSDEEQVLNSLRPHQCLSSLSISSFGGKEFPSWLGEPSFSSMVEVELTNCCQIKLLPPLGQLKSLKKLSIEGLSAVKEVGVEFYNDDSCFSCLETLEISHMYQWELWSWSNGLCEDSVAKFPKLRELRIVYCPKLVGKLPSFLPSLEKVDICDCQLLVDLPKVLPSLLTLSISRCQESVLRSVSNATSLTTLKIEGVSGLVRLDEALTKTLGSLEVLEIWSCDELRYLWADGTNLDYLTSLKRLEIVECNQLVSLVNGEEGLLPCNLEVLEVYKCPNLKELSSGLSNLKSLNDLRISSCGSLVSFPARGLPHNLIRLIIGRCGSLESLPEGNVGHCNYSSEMSHLEELYIYECKSLRSSLNGKYPDSLKTLNIRNWTTQSLNSLYYGLSHLTILQIWNCPQLESFPGMELHIPTLNSLQICDCERLRSLSSHMQNLQCLQYLQISTCHQLELFPKMGLPNPMLVSFQIYGCKNLRSLPNHMQHLTSLRSLKVSYCRGMESLTEGCLPPNLSELSIYECLNLKQPMPEWGLHRLASFKKLTIHDSGSTRDMVSFPDDDGLLLPTSLTDLRISKFKNLKSISRGIQKLISLQELDIQLCWELHSIPDEGFPATLEELSVSCCPLLQDRCLKDRGGDYWPIISHIPRIRIN